MSGGILGGRLVTAALRWILSNATWADHGIWDDAATWQDEQ